MASPTLYRWSAGDVASRHRFDSWVDAVANSYGLWNLNPLPSQSFDAHLAATQLGSVRLVECSCDPFSADRAHGSIGREDDHFAAIQIVKSGRERITYSGKATELTAGDVYVWDSTRPMAFEVVERLDKVSLVLPLGRLRAWARTGARSMGRRIAPGSPSQRLLYSFVSTLAEQSLAGEAVDPYAIAEAAVAILFSSKHDLSRAQEDSLKATQLKTIKRFIADHLDDPELSIGKISEANRVSARYLHWVFSGSGESVSRHILEQRLQRSRRDLLNPLLSQLSISEVAFSVGFHSPSHFSRCYRKRFEESPRQTRERVVVGSATKGG